MRHYPWRLVCLSLFGLSAIACSDLEAIEPDVCGNFAVDPAEDCDGSSPFTCPEATACGAPGTTNACFFICDEESGAVCPDGWGCGTDGRCRKPSGHFVQGPNAPYRFPVESFGVGDVDGDGFADLIGNSTAAINVRFGSPDGSFDDELEVFTRPATGALSFQHLNEDPLLDVLIPIRGGLFTLLGTEDRNLEPVAYAPFDAGADQVRLIPLPSDEDINLGSPILILETDLTRQEPHFLHFYKHSGMQNQRTVPKGAKDIAGRIPVANLRSSDGDEQANIAGSDTTGGRYSFALAYLGHEEVYIYSTCGEEGDSLRPNLVQTVTLPPESRIGPQGVHFADIGSANLDLIIHAIPDNPGVEPDEIAVLHDVGVTNPGSCPNNPPVVNSDWLGMRAEASGKLIPFPLAVADITGDGRADFITPKGLFVSDRAGANPTDNHLFNVGSNPPGSLDWNYATIGDYNSDGNLDFATSLPGTDALFVYLGQGIGPFNEFVIATEFPPFMLRSGDFDGDLITDIAFVQKPMGKPDRVSVSFGSTTGSTSKPVSMGALGKVEVLEPAIVKTPSGLDAIPDLLVASEFVVEGASKRSVAFLEGSTARRMVSPFALPAFETAMGTKFPVVPVQVSAGSFAGEDQVRDVLIVAPIPDPDLDPDNTLADKSLLYTLKGIGNGQFEAVTSTSNSNSQSTFDVTCSLWTVGDLDTKIQSTGALAQETAIVEGNTDELIGFDNAFNGANCQEAKVPAIAVTNDDNAMTSDPLLLNFSEVPVVNDLTAVADIELFDADNDGFQDVVVVYRGQDDNSSPNDAYASEGDGIAVYWNDNQGALASNSPLNGSDVGVRSAAPILLTGEDATPELLVLGSRGLYLSTLDTGNRNTFTTLEFWQATDPYERFEVGDLNGDGLTDLALTFGDQVDILLSEPAPPRGSYGDEVSAKAENNVACIGGEGQ